ncbi:hypothetical protein CHARACLAT_023110 [Characodon lateralis]|uniref:Uncharacterized protein n=1 Tax=Characodon lateralis TaxID=208331 RepID=A0ABU7CQI4_9TELE|nr:hypothetical protein [Characodon lateralis]
MTLQTPGATCGRSVRTLSFVIPLPLFRHRLSDSCLPSESFGSEELSGLPAAGSVNFPRTGPPTGPPAGSLSRGAASSGAAALQRNRATTEAEPQGRPPVRLT